MVVDGPGSIERRTRWRWPLALAFVILVAWLGTTGSPARPWSVDGFAQGYVDAGLKRALVTFAAARGLNAVLSIVQSADVSFQPLGVGVEVGVGQLLRPINDLVGQFAELMMMASVVFAAMEVLIRIGGHWLVTLAFSVLGAVLAHRHWHARPAGDALVRAFVIVGVLRFAVPVVAIANEGIYRTFMADEYAASQGAILATSERIGKEASPASAPPGAAKDDKPLFGGIFRGLAPKPPAEAPAPPKEAGIAERFKDWTAPGGDLTGRLGRLVQTAEQMAEHVIRLMVVFLLQTLVIPLLLGWGLLRLLGFAVRAWPRGARRRA